MAELIPEVVVLRLPIYLRALSLLAQQNVEVVNSTALGAQLRMTPAQIRKDLSYFGKFGKQGTGYNVKSLLRELRLILGLDRQWPMVLVGVGRLGHAIVSYGGFAPEGFNIVAAFDNDPLKIGTQVGSLTVQDVAELERVVKERGVQIGIVAVPADQAQQVIKTMVDSGIRTILNYAPIAPRIPPHLRIRDIDPVAALQSMTFYLKNQNKGGT